MNQKIWRFFKASAIITLAFGVPFLIWGIFAAQDTPKVNLAKAYIEASSEIKQIVGKIEGYSFGVTDNVEAGRKKSRMALGVEGSKQDIKVVLLFQKNAACEWIIEGHALR